MNTLSSEPFMSARPGRRHSAYLLIGIAVAALAGGVADAGSLPALLILPLDMFDTSGEIPARTQEYDDRLASLTSYLTRSLADERIYSVVDQHPISAAIASARATQRLSECNGCERDLARLVRADRVLVGEVDKISTLIGNLNLRIVDVATGRVVVARTLSFRGDTDEAWQRAGDFFVRDLKQIPAQAR